MSLNCTIKRSESKGKNKGWWMPLLVFAFLVLTSTGLMAQTPTVSATECNCLNNASAAGDDGQFQDIITINGPAGKTWKVKHVTGLFKATSPAPPAAPDQITVGQVITETSSGVYTLTARRIDRTSWSITFTDGINDLNITSARRCAYPSKTIIGDKGVCVNKSRSYHLDIPANLIRTIQWTVSMPASITGSANSANVTVQYPGTTGTVTLTAVGTAWSYVGQTVGFCNFNISNDIILTNDFETLSLACNNKTNVTLDGKCRVEITPDMITESLTRPLYTYDIVLRDREADTLLPSAWVDGRYVNKTLEVNLYHDCTGNHCWGTILIEDKSIPTLTCVPLDTIDCNEVDLPEVTGLPLPPTAFYMRTGPNSFKVSDFDYCSLVTLTYEDEQISAHCHSGISASFLRTWIAKDALGNTTTCEQVISVRQASIEEVVFPPNYDSVLGPNESLDACGDWVKLPNGHPDPISTGYPTGRLCQNLVVNFEDIRYDICTNDKTFKIRRKWIVRDGCTGAERQAIQTITVMDNEAPVVITPNDFTVATSDHICVGNVNVPVPQVDDCIQWDYTIAFKPVDDSGDPYTDAWTEGILKVDSRKYVITGLPEGYTKFWISYYIYDGCGNTTRTYTTAMIMDDKEPIAVCKQFTFVGLNENGQAWAGVESFDDGSHDNCMIDYIELRRMENTACGLVIDWDDKVMFCCEDVGKTIMVQMRVVDKSGNSNTCMVEVTVQDNTPPHFHFCPADTMVNCDAELWDFTGYGQPIVKDSCGFKLEEKISRQLNDCGIGKIYRTFIATDLKGNSSSCTQTIMVQPISPFNSSHIIWPADYTFTNGCRAFEITPEDLPSDRRYPRFREKACSRPAYQYEDIVFQYAEGACFKILREWTVIDWCQFDPRTPYQTSWKHTQVIKVINSVGPTITKGCSQDDLIIEDLDSCKAKITLSALATDDCPGAILKYGYEIDLFNDGTTEYAETGQTIMRIVPYGNHKITWWVKDECGNVTRCTRIFVVRDGKAPTPTCHSQVVTVVMPTSQSITIWAKDFIKYGADNCTPENKLKYSFTNNPKDSSKVFTCEDFVTYGNAGVPVRVYVFDEAGNYDYCEATLLLQDNAGVCTGTSAGTKVTLSGKITDGYGRVVSDVELKVDANLPEFPKQILTRSNGVYEFSGLKKFVDYLVEPSKKGSANLGINTLDVLQLQRHILSLKKLDSHAKMIAADVDGDERLSIADIVSLRKMILGISDHFDRVPAWRFVTESGMKKDNMYPLEQVIFIGSMSRDEVNQNFIALKTGDIDGSYTSFNDNQETKGRSNKVLAYETWAYKKGDIVTIDLNFEDKNINGFQFSFAVDAAIAEFIDADNDEGTVYYHTNDGVNVRIMAADAKNGVGTVRLLFRMNRDTEGEDFIRATSELASEAYFEDGNELRSAGLSLVNKAIKDPHFSGLKVYQNVPNPFTTETEISFEIDKEQSVSLQVYNAEGKLILTKSNQFGIGLNSFRITEDDLKTKGILFYQIITKTHYSGRRMIKLN